MSSMNEESLLLASVWDALSGYVSTNDKQEAANSLVAAFIENGIDANDLLDADGEDTYLDKAILSLREEDEEDEPDY